MYAGINRYCLDQSLFSMIHGIDAREMHGFVTLMVCGDELRVFEDG